VRTGQTPSATTKKGSHAEQDNGPATAERRADDEYAAACSERSEGAWIEEVELSASDPRPGGIPIAAAEDSDHVHQIAGLRSHLRAGAGDSNQHRRCSRQNGTAASSVEPGGSFGEDCRFRGVHHLIEGSPIRAGRENAHPGRASKKWRINFDAMMTKR
jgi:hypothetical protein